MTIAGILIFGAIIGAAAIALAVVEKLCEPEYTAEVKFLSHRNQGQSFHSMEYSAVLTSKKTGETYNARISRFPHIYKNEEAYIRKECDKIYRGWIQNGNDYSI